MGFGWCVKSIVDEQLSTDLPWVLKCLPDLQMAK